MEAVLLAGMVVIVSLCVNLRIDILKRRVERLEDRLTP